MSMIDEPCPVCGQGYLTPKVDTMSVVLNGTEYELPSHFALCNTCHSEIADADDINQNAEYMKLLSERVQCDLREQLLNRPSHKGDSCYDNDDDE